MRRVSLLLPLLLVSCGLASAAPQQQQQCTLRVLALGDSTTKGAVPGGRDHPYSGQLAETLRAGLAGRAGVQVTTAAYNYMGVWQKARDDSDRELDVTLVPFAQQQLAAARQAGRPYNWVIVLGGINDLGNSNKSAAAIMPRLIQIYDMFLAAGTNVLAVQPWPNRFVTQTSDNERQRQLLNGMIREHVSSSSSSGSRGRLFLATLPRDSFDFWALPASKVAQLQADKLHLTPQGYDLLGRVLAQQLLVLAGSSPCSGGKGRQ